MEESRRICDGGGGGGGGRERLAWGGVDDGFGAVGTSIILFGGAGGSSLSRAIKLEVLGARGGAGATDGGVR